MHAVHLLIGGWKDAKHRNRRTRRNTSHRPQVEVVERKGLGHPDYICDSIMNQVSVDLCREYIDRFGAIMHHNIDKGMLVAGEVKTKFQGGVILKPMRIILGTGLL